MQHLTGVHRREMTVQDGDNLEQTTGRPIYADCRIGEIRLRRATSSWNSACLAVSIISSGSGWGDVEATGRTTRR